MCGAPTTLDAMSESESSELESEVSTDDMQHSAHESGSDTETEDMAHFSRSPRVSPRRYGRVSPVRRDMPSASEDEDKSEEDEDSTDGTDKGKTNGHHSRRPSRTPSPSHSPSHSPKSSPRRVKLSKPDIKLKSKTTATATNKATAKAKRSNERSSKTETQKPAAVDEAQLRMLAATDAPLPLPDACVKYIHAMEEPERLKRVLVKFEDPVLHFDPTDIKKAQQLLVAAEARKATATEAGIAVDTMAARVAMLARACNERWAQILQLVRDGDLHPDDTLMDYLTQRQFQMRRELVDAIQALGEAYE